MQLGVNEIAIETLPRGMFAMNVLVMVLMTDTVLALAFVT